MILTLVDHLLKWFLHLFKFSLLVPPIITLQPLSKKDLAIATPIPPSPPEINAT